MRNWNRNQRIPTKTTVNDFVVLPNGDLVTAQYDTAAMSEDDSILVWDTKNWTIKRRLLGERDEVLCLALLENGDLVSAIYLGYYLSNCKNSIIFLMNLVSCNVKIDFC